MTIELLPHVSTSLSPVVRAAAGLLDTPKTLPPWLFYDERGSVLFEEITRLPEYYPTRVERSILTQHADAMIARAAGAHAEKGRAKGAPLSIIELGAGTAIKTDLLLAAAVRLQGQVDFYPADVSPAPLQVAADRLAARQPQVRVHPLLGPHEAAMRGIRAVPGRRLVLFIGSSIGNFDHFEAIELLNELRNSMRAGDALLLGADMRKKPSILIPAYDDAAGVTAQFNLNVLARLNREAGAHFDPALFRHVAVWNDEQSRIEMHLESRIDQVVPIAALESPATFRAGERIHTESSHKYDAATIELLLESAGFAPTAVYADAQRWFTVNLATAVGKP